MEKKLLVKLKNTRSKRPYTIIQGEALLFVKQLKGLKDRQTITQGEAL